MTRVVTNAGAIQALALSPELVAVSMRKATAGAADAARRSRRRTGAMAAGWSATPIAGGARVGSGPDYTQYHEYGTSRIAAQPMARPSMDVARSA